MAGQHGDGPPVDPRRNGLGALLAGLALAGTAACSVSDVMSPRPSIDVGISTAALPLAPAGPPILSLEPADPGIAAGRPLSRAPASSSGAFASPGATAPQTVAYPRLAPPPDEAAIAVMPAGETACRTRLGRLGVRFRDLPAIDDGGACRIDWPVEVSGLSGGIEMSPPATLNCQMAETFARWTRNELAPAARTRYLSGIAVIRQGSSYSCRRIAGTGVASEHAKGNALDVMAVVLNNGRRIDVRKPGFFAFRQRGLLNAVRAEGCDYFTTVLGPGYDRDHRDHFHFDLKGRRNGYRACR